ncbi:UDP-glucose flavonoid 3-O-glucosyltransferase 7 [Sesbania bispinosa]|nr:UDP-glucose flavonoid 3-O-glucosyltransferase 7 [Sesbania bispinosa]
MHGVDVTILTTTANATTFQASIDRDSNRGHPIRTHVVKFPQIDGLPEGMESINASTPKDLQFKNSQGLSILQGIFQQLFRDLKSNFIVIDMLVYIGASYMAHCAIDSVERFTPHTKGPYEEHYKTVIGTKSWSLEPVSLWVNQDALDKASRGHTKEDGKEEELLTWLDSKTEDSILYVSFRSMNNFPATQLVKVAHALEDSGVDFIWVVRIIDGANGFLEEFEKRVQQATKII